MAPDSPVVSVTSVDSRIRPQHRQRVMPDADRQARRLLAHAVDSDFRLRPSFPIRHSSFVISFILLLFPFSTLNAQAAAPRNLALQLDGTVLTNPGVTLTNQAAQSVVVSGTKTRSSRVLQLVGEGSFVELPPDIFTNLSEQIVAEVRQLLTQRTRSPV